MTIREFYNTCIELQSNSKNCIVDVRYTNCDNSIEISIYVYNIDTYKSIRVITSDNTSDTTFNNHLNRLKEILNEH